MKATARFYGHLRPQAGRRDLELDLAPGTTLAHFLRMVEERLGPEAGVHLHPFHGGHYALLIAVNGQDHHFVGGLEAPLPEGALVDLMPPLSGGRQPEASMVSSAEPPVEGGRPTLRYSP